MSNQSLVPPDSAAPEAIDANYRRAGFTGHLQFGNRPALLVVDVVQAYLDHDSPLYAEPFETALQSNVRLAAVARRQGIPAISRR